ncbi:MAG: FHA domain-containing protein [Planctomycetota bacterium]
MLGHWLYVRIRAAEKALENGRVEEAYGVAIQADVRTHRRGRKLCEALVKPLQARARLHLQAGRHVDALADLDKLAAIGHTGPDFETLRQRVVGQMREKQHRETDERQAYKRAAEDIDAGRLETGRLALDNIDDTQRRDELREDLDIRLQRSAQLLTQADEALNRGDVLTALRFWREARERHGRSQSADEMATRLAPALHNTLDEWFTEGRLDRFVGACTAMAAMRAADPVCEEYEQMADLCARGIAQLRDREYPALRQTLLRLQQTRADVRWVKEGLGVLSKIAASQESLQASPLGLYTSMAGPATAIKLTQPAPRQPTTPLAGPATSLIPNGLLMLVDGSGSSLVLSQDCVYIGRASSSQHVDIALPADIQAHHADILRAGEDYFLTAYGPVRVNNRTVKRTLLRDGDRVVLGPKAKFVFRKPSVRSTSAVLELSHRCRLAQDVSSVVLFRETCLIGPQPSCHLRTKEGESQVVVFDRDGQLYGRTATGAGGQLGDPKPLTPDQTLDFGDQRVTVKIYTGGNLGHQT